MSEEAEKNTSIGPACRLAIAALFVALLAGCARFQEIFAPSAPGVRGEWAALLEDIRAFERRIGFRETDNFVDFSADEGEFPFCGYASRFYLPYSYEDPAIRWLESVTEEECRKLGGDSDIYFGAVEAWGESGTPVTPSMITNKLDRFLYLVIHEDCHDQFDLPYGIEEALCDVITYKAMAVFTEERFGSYARENSAIRRYANAQSRLARATIAFYEQLAGLYSRHERGEISSDALLQERAAIFDKAERPLGWARGELNNVGIATDMTYCRHYPFLERVFEALGGDPARTVAFFRHVDSIKPSRAAVMKQHGIASEQNVQFIRAYEAAVTEAIRTALADRARASAR